MAKLLFFQWNAFMQKGIENALIRKGIDYDVYTYYFSNWDKDDSFVEEFSSYIRGHREIKTVFSVNFSPLISDVCEKTDIIYKAWVYDAPLHIRKVCSLKNKCNHIYFFDRVQAEFYSKQGMEHVYHLPLAVDAEYFKEEHIKQEYGALVLESIKECDVSLVGQLYKSDFSYLCKPLDMYDRGYLEGIVNAQLHVDGGYFVDEIITDGLLERLNKIYRERTNGEFQVTDKELEYAIATEVTGRCRFMALSLLESRADVHLYSGDYDDRLKNTVWCGRADYYSQMPEVFRKSKINLNISLSIIKTGIPLRVLDVLGSGGFLITNYKPEIAEYFEDGIDLVIYEDMKDLVIKVKYYLSHEEERKAIARNGYEKVKRLFTFDEKIDAMGLD
ncbi:MAG: DUF3880 domain-containing protein [Eubacteriales bacterium]|nr:DUF3880 domain-containing protein [Eubacteriales bacterium]